MNKSDIHSFDKDLPTFSTEEPMIQKCAKLNNESINGMVNRLIDEELLKQGLKKRRLNTI